MPIGHKLFIQKYPKQYELAVSMGNKYYPDYLGRFPWEISSSISKKKLGDLMFNLHLKGGAVSSSFTLGIPESAETARGYGVWFIVWVRPEYIAELDPNFKPAAMPHVN